METTETGHSSEITSLEEVVLQHLPDHDSSSIKNEISKRVFHHPQGIETEIEEKRKNSIYYLPLYKATIKGDWITAEHYFEENPRALTANITDVPLTALHVAIGTGLSLEFVKNLVALMPKESLGTRDNYDNTPLHSAAAVGNTEAAKILVQQNPRLPQLVNKFHETPLHSAAKFAHKETVCYLLKVTRHEHPSPFTGKVGARLLILLLVADFYGFALHLLKRFPELAHERDHHNNTALGILARKPHAFPSGSQLGCFQHLLYKCICLKKGDVAQGGDTGNPVEYEAECREHCMRFRFLQHIYNTKLMHEQTCKIVRILCEEAVKSIRLEAEDVFGPPMRMATIMGIHELVTEIIKAYPFSVWFRERNRKNDISNNDEDCSVSQPEVGGPKKKKKEHKINDDEHNFFHLAVLHRKENIFNLLYQMSLQKNYVMEIRDKKGNNILHLAGMLGPSNKIAGAALHMQRELKWFKEVEKHVKPSFKGRRNIDKKFPSQVFTENHKELVKEGEKWMKNTATSYTVVAALVATFVFTAAFTPPGGNDSDGIPNFLNESAFMIYAISDALSLFTSSISVLMFLSILTSRYSEEDFLEALPRRLSIGLITLFISIASMLVAFCASLYIMLVHRVKWIAAPIVLLACIPVTFFGRSQFRLLVELVYSTFGPSIFGRKRKGYIC